MRKLLVLGILLASTLGIVGSAQAYEISTGDQTSLSSDKSTNGSYYAAGNNVDVNGTVKGDVFCAGQNVTINGPVEGDVICAAQNITINGPVSGNVRLAAQTVNLNGTIGRNANVLSQTLVASKDSVITGELMAQVAAATLNGTINGETYGNAQQLTINGSVTGKVSYAAEAVSIGSAAKLGGGLEYTSSKKADIKSGAQITGDTKQNIATAPENKRQDTTESWLSGFLFNLLSALVVGVLLLWFAPRFIAGATVSARRPGFTMLMGFAALVLTPIAAVMLMFTIIGIPAGILGLTAWGVALYLSHIVAALAIGTLLYRQLNKGDRPFRPYAAGALGILVASLIFAIPFVGGFAAFLAVLFGLGVMVQALRDHIDREDSGSAPQVSAKKA